MPIRKPYRGRRVKPPTRLRLVNLEDRTTPTIINVVPAPTPTAADNDYTRIQNAVNTAANGDTIHLAGTFDFTETNAAASWAKGSDGVAGTFDDYSVYVPDGLTGVAITATTLGDAIIKGPGDLPAFDLEAFLYFDGDNYQGWTIANLDIRNFDMAVGMFAEAPVFGAYDNVTVTNNHILIATDLNGVAAPSDPLQNVGVTLGYGRNQTVSWQRV